ncbi:ribosome-inactivating family protein [Streptomyces sp. SAS_270]|uniref:ribosome-inactivating family protein n=1 Tax=Streptomyces sp. SAS_270 TaxID=3412748 RepID=UPI00403CC40C
MVDSVSNQLRQKQVNGMWATDGSSTEILHVCLRVGKCQITLQMRLSDARMVGYRQRENGIYWYLSDSPGKFPSAVGNSSMGFSSTYEEMERHSRGRCDIPLGPHALENAVLFLAARDPRDDLHTAALSWLILVQMVAEAARFVPVREEIGQSFKLMRDAPPSARALDLENAWGELSRCVREASNQYASVSQPIRIDGTPYSQVSAMASLLTVGLGFEP